MSDTSTQPDPRRWFALVVIAIAQLMVVLDASIVNIALPKAAHYLHIAAQNRQWAVTAYTITFGGFLLLGGRIGDYLGRKRAFIIGLLGFAAVSLIGGLSVNQQMLFAARACQGLFGALLAPAALSLISVTFSDSKERATAFGVYGALSGVGAAIGLIAGGLLTQYISWRWCLFVNTPMALIAVSLAIPNVRESQVQGHPKYDVPGALTATIGMVGIVYGVSQASVKGWGSTGAWPFMLAGAVLIAMFFVIEARVSSPLLPLRLITDRIRAGAYLTSGFIGLGIFGMFLLMTFYFQTVLGYSAIKSGLLFLPFSLSVIVSAGVGSQLIPKIGPRPVATVGPLFAAVGLFWLSFITPHSSYPGHVMLAMLCISFGLGMTFVALASTSLFNVPHEDSGAASAVLNTTQQVGGSFGTAIMNTLYVSSLNSAMAAYVLLHHLPSKRAIPRPIVAAMNVHGFDVAFRYGAIVMVVAALHFFTLVNIDRHHLKQNDEVVAVGAV